MRRGCTASDRQLARNIISPSTPLNAIFPSDSSPESVSASVSSSLIASYWQRSIVVSGGEAFCFGGCSFALSTVVSLVFSASPLDSGINGHPRMKY
jgi:hypothetical protein